MVARKRTFLLVMCLSMFALAKAQTEPVRKWKVAVFAPLYLDSVFSNGVYKLGNSNLPRYVLPGLDFYNGIMMAIDSLNKEALPLEVLIYDTKSAKETLEDLLQKPELIGTSLLIGSFTSRTEVKPLADYALTNQIPLLSATYPNDGGVTENPYFVLLNPALRTHCEAIYRYLQRFYPTNNILVFRRKGVPEDQIQSVFEEMSRNTQGVPIKVKTIELTDQFIPTDVTQYLDSTRQNIVVSGTLNETFGLNLVKVLGSQITTYKSIAIGMPTWDALKDIDKVGVDIVYSTPYYFNRTDRIASQLNTQYRAKYFGRPSDMFFKGYETMYHFSKLLLKYDTTLLANLSDKSFKIFNDFDVQAIPTNKEGPLPEYLENKKLYFIRKKDGQVRSIQ